MATTTTKKDAAIKFQFPTRKANAYLKKAGGSSFGKLSHKQLEAVFVMAVDGFMKGELSLDELSGLCNHLWFEALPGKEKFSTELAHALYSGAELAYYVRHTMEESAAKTFIGFLNDVVGYYTKKERETAGA